MSIRDQLRAKTIGKPKSIRKKPVTIDVDGEPVEFELRSPSLADLDWITEQSSRLSPSGTQMIAPGMVAALLKCVYPPGEDRHVFEATDRERLEAEPVGSWVTVLAKEATEFLKENAEVIKAKKS